VTRIVRGTLALLLFAAATAVAQSAAVTTVILVRHAEKAAAPANDPPLTPAGEARANALYEAVRDAGVSAIITTQFVRTRASAQPTATALGITPEIVNTTGATHALDVAAAIRKHAGQTVLVVGHSNTIPAIIAALGAKQPAAICDPEYDGFYVVRVAAGEKTGVVRSRYGEPSHLDATCGAMR
jgi:broad specificity phosphatase PhoE